MIPYRPIAPLTAGPKKGWRAAVAAVVMAALPGTTAPIAVAAEPVAASTAAAAAATGAPLVATEPSRRNS